MALVIMAETVRSSGRSPANNVSKSFQFNRRALAPVAASLYSHTAQFSETKRRGGPG
jgi:hypothetical protein